MKNRKITTRTIFFTISLALLLVFAGGVIGTQNYLFAAQHYPTPIATQLYVGNPVSTHAALQNAIDTAPTDGTQRIIFIANDIVIPDPLVIHNGRNILLASNGTNLTTHTGSRFAIINNRTGSTSSNVVSAARVEFGSMLTISNIVFDGNSYQGGHVRGGLIITNNSHLVMHPNTIIMRNNTAAAGGGVRLGRNSTFTMYGGEIRDNVSWNNGGAVSVANFNPTGEGADDGIFIMHGGLITNNIAGGHGGNGHGALQITGTGIAHLHGGTISNNTTMDSWGGGGIILRENNTRNTPQVTIEHGVIIEGNFGRYGGGVQVRTGTLTMNGGVIRNNLQTPDGDTILHGGGVNMIGGTFNMHGGTIEDNHALQGGGVRVSDDATFNMHGGTIRGNVAEVTTSVGGGGVEVIMGGTMTMSGGVIEHNKSYYVGGGVHVNSGSSFTMSGNAIIRNNRSNVSGGGVNVNLATFTMNGGSIYGNQHLVSGTGGGGVRVIHGSTFTMTAGTIRNNTTVNFGGGVAVNEHSTFTMSGGSIEGNTAGTNGGGVWAGSGATLDISNSSIVRNRAGQDGGGIWTITYNQANFLVSNTVYFRLNRAATAHDHGEDNDADSVPPGVPALDADPFSGAGAGANGGDPRHIGWATVSIPGTHALNNFDINYRGRQIPTPPPPYTPVIRKELRMPSGTVFPSESFSFDFELELVRFWPTQTLPEVTIPEPPATLSATFSTAAGAVDVPGVTGYVFVYTNVNIYLDLADVAWPRPGIYTFIVSETGNSSGINANDSNYTITYDLTEFTLVVHVGRRAPYNMDDPLEILAVYASLPCYGCPPGSTCAPCECGCWTSDKNDNNPVMTFVNYLRYIPSAVYFEVSKTVQGYMADPNRAFNFTVNFALYDNAPLPTGEDAITFTVSGYVRNGVVIDASQPRVVSTPAPISGLTHTFTLRHGDIITFANVPVGTNFTVTEPYVAGYDQSGIAVAGGVEVMDEVAGEGEALVLSGEIDVLATGGAANSRGVFNYVAVLNEIPEEPPMGVLLSNVPFGLMVAIGAGALVATGAVAIAHGKKKKR